MCGIAGSLNLSSTRIPDLTRRLSVMNDLQKHRGPDGHDLWQHPRRHVGFAHRRLSIIDLDTGHQPMSDRAGNWITYNGEIYNYLELRDDLGENLFVTHSDTEVILHGYRKWGEDCIRHFRGMFAFALWDDVQQTLFCARDRFGVKPFYYAIVDGIFYFASESKALLPFVSAIETDLEAFKEYLSFQFCLGGKTLFKGIRELPPGHVLLAKNGVIDIRRYWEVYYDLDFNHTAKYFEEKIRSLLEESVIFHLGAMCRSAPISAAGLIPALWHPWRRHNRAGSLRGSPESFHSAIRMMKVAMPARWPTTARFSCMKSTSLHQILRNRSKR